MRHSILILWVIAVLGSGCGAKLPSMKPFKMEIQQGNVVTSKMLLQLRPGMTRAQVRYIMGTPLVVDSFRDNRWDYFYDLRKQGVIVEKRRVILDFDKDSLVSVRGDVVPAGENGESKTIVESAPTANTANAEAKQDASWLDKLKFWSSEEAKTAQSPAANTAAASAAAKPSTEKPASTAPTVSANPSAAASTGAVTVTPPAATTSPAQPSASAATNAASQEEVIPYIPEGEYVAPVVPSEAEMVQGNSPEAKQPATDAQASSITQHGVAPATPTEGTPTFMAEQLPEPEPVLPPADLPPAPASAATPAMAKAPVAAAALPAVDLSATNPPMTADESGVKQALAVWAQAWRSKQVKPYLAAYAADFVPDNAPSRAAWEAQRKQRLAATTGAITLNLDAVMVKAADGLAVAQFVQTYAAKNYRDQTKKMLELRYLSAEQRWVITRERVMSSMANDVPAAAAPVSANPDASKAASPPAADTAAQAEVLQAVENWAQAWRNKNTAAYFAAYDATFMPEGMPDKASWEATRKKRLAPQQGKINLEITAIQVSVAGDRADAVFTQKYAAKSYRDEMQKRLRFKRDATTQRWLIVQETAATGANDPAARQQVTAPEDSAEHLDGVLEQIGF